MEVFTQEIYNWYLTNKRDLPWRKTSDPYKIWISEIILQQTRVAQGLNYYLRFIEEFPTVNDLACASEDYVLKLWQGLGYYTRARNLHYTAKQIVEKYNGTFPSDYNSILSLKGIGEYTAAAIASIAFDLPYATVDGNIIRVISRYFGILTPFDTEKGKNEVKKFALEMVPDKNSGFHNQALMEFGALQCIPKSPDCIACPLNESCYAAMKGLVEKIPVKSKKVKQSSRYFYYFIIENEDSVFLEKRTLKDIWKNLYQFPMIESENELSDAGILALEFPFNSDKAINIKSVSPVYKHLLTHQTIFARFIHVETNEIIFVNRNIIQVNKKDIYKFAVPKLLERYLDTHENW